jgi:DNA-binding transcriptional MerR regulator
MKLLDISDVANRSGVPASALRYYEELGLISSVGRHGLRRQFGPEVLLQLTLIAMGRAAGFSLEEIRTIFGADGKPSIPRAQLLAKAEELDRQVRKLSALSGTIRHVAECKAPSHFACPKFGRLMRLAGRTKTRTPQRSRF